MAVFFAQYNFLSTFFSLATLASRVYEGRSTKGYRGQAWTDHLDPETETLAGIDTLAMLPGIRYSRGNVTYARSGDAFLVGGARLSLDDDKHLVSGQIKYLSFHDYIYGDKLRTNYWLYDFSISARQLMKVAKTTSREDDRAFLAQVVFAGDDFVYAQKKAEYMRIDTGRGEDFVSGGLKTDRLTLGAGDDVGKGNMGNDRILGGDGNDLIFGGAGKDTLYGDAGNDIIVDLVNGTDKVPGSILGLDFLYGGEGADVFVVNGLIPTANWYGSVSEIADYTDGVDKIAILGPQISFSDLGLYPGGPLHPNSTMIVYNNEIVAFIEGTPPPALGADDFILGADAKAVIASGLRHFMDNWDYAV